MQAKSAGKGAHGKCRHGPMRWGYRRKFREADNISVGNE